MRCVISNQWLQRQRQDLYVKKAKQLGYRSRAAFKLLAIQEKYKLFRPGQCIVDLGAAPGGWSQVASHFVGSKGSVIALDRLAMDPLPGVQFLKGDFRKPTTIQAFRSGLLKQKSAVALVLSDLAPNLSGIIAVDQAKSLTLAQAAFDFCQRVLMPKGGFLVKVFQGEGIEAYLMDLKSVFSRVRIVKPAASRAASREIYILALDFKSYLKQTEI